MWIYLPWGFFSVIRYKGDPLITVRARRLRDLEALRENYLPDLGPVKTDKLADYPHRAKANPVSFVTALARIALSIDYANVKGATAVVGGPGLTAVYHRVHHETKRLDDLRPQVASLGLYLSGPDADEFEPAFGVPLGSDAGAARSRRQSKPKGQRRRPTRPPV
jgi:hypothetical protein